MKRQKSLLAVLLVIGLFVAFYSVLAYAQAPAERTQPGQAPAEAPAVAPPAEQPAAQPPAEEAKPAEQAPAAAQPQAAPSAGKPAMVSAFLWVNFILGLWLLVSPWIMAGENAPLKWNTTITGLIVAVLSLIAALS